MMDRYEKYLQENSQLKKNLNSHKLALNKALSELEACQEISKMQSEQLVSTRKQLELQHKKYQSLLEQKQSLESTFQDLINNLKISIDQKQNELNQLQNKIMPSFDHDMLRIKILNQLQIPHRLQMQKKSQEVERVRDQQFECMRKLQTNKKKLQTIRTEYQEQIKLLKQQNINEINRFAKQLQSVREQRQDRKDKQQLKSLRKVNDELRQRLLESQEKVLDLKEEIQNCMEDIKLIESLKKMNEALKDQLKSAAAASEEVRRTLDFKDSQINTLKHRITSLKNQLQLASNANEQLQHTLAALHSSIRSTDDLHNQTVRELSQKVRVLQNGQISEERSTHRARVQLDSFKDQLKAMQERWNHQKQKSRQLQMQLQKYGLQLREARMNELQFRDRLKEEGRRSKALQQENLRISLARNSLDKEVIDMVNKGTPKEQQKIRQGALIRELRKYDRQELNEQSLPQNKQVLKKMYRAVKAQLAEPQVQIQSQSQQRPTKQKRAKPGPEAEEGTEKEKRGKASLHPEAQLALYKEKYYKLKQKLKLANQKIVSLLNQKMHFAMRGQRPSQFSTRDYGPREIADPLEYEILEGARRLVQLTGY